MPFVLPKQLAAFLRKPLFWLIAAVVMVSIAVAGQLFHWGRLSACPPEEICSAVTRSYYPARHWSWSGIFPFEGGFIPDPHFRFSGSMQFPEPVLKILGDPNAKYQVVEVNPAFNDESTEILLVIQSGEKTYQYSLEFAKGRNVRAVLGFPMQPEARVFPYKGSLAVLDCFFGPAKGIYLIQLPLRQGATAPLIPAGSAKFEEIANEFKSIASDPSIKQQFCKTDLPFAAFYEKYSGSCNWTPIEYATNPSVRNYESFWMSIH